MKAQEKVLTVALIAILSVALPVPYQSSFAKFDDRQLEQIKGSRKALLIGIGNYQSSAFPKLEFPLNDVARLGELLESPSYGFKVTRLTDETPNKPTRNNILQAIQTTLIDDAREGDTILFYFSGHGSSILNSLSDEPDKRDETIIPLDGARPVKDASQLKDIRDKELAELFNRALDKKVTLTAVFDSCHSGSIARNDNRSKEVEALEFDIKARPTGAQTINPGDRGALIITAAEDYQTASGGTYELNGKTAAYSHFTAELLRTLYEDPADRASSRDLFRRVMARLLAAGRSQTPTFKGTPDRMERTLFGAPTKETTGRIRAPITIKEENRISQTLLAAGLADGLTDGVELRRIQVANGKETEPPVRIRIKKAGLSLSVFEVLRADGTSAAPASADGIREGQTFEQATWVTKQEPDLTVWIPPAVLNETALKAVATRLQAAGTANSARFLSEPTGDSLKNIVFFDDADGRPEWKIYLSNGAVEGLGDNPTQDSVSQLLVKNKLEPTANLFLDLPPSTEMRKAMVSGLRDGGVILSDKRDTANYELVGRLNSETGSIEYAWVLRAALERQNEKVRAGLGQGNTPPLSLPPITDWVTGPTAEADLKTLALRLGKIRGWLKLSSPIAVGSSAFPYRLEIRERGSGRILKTGDTMYADKDYDLALTATPSSLAGGGLMAQFWVYVLTIDSNGNGNYLDREVNEKYGGINDFVLLDPTPAHIPLAHKDGTPLKVYEPFGVETYILLVTDRPVDENVFSFYGVRGQQVATRGEFSPLAKLLKGLGADVRSKGDYSTPDSWAVQQLILRSAEKS